MTKKSKIYIIYTGGTIGMAPEDPNNTASPLEPKSLNDLKKYIPALEAYKDFIEFGEISPFNPPLDSSDIRPKNWIKIAEEIKLAYDAYDGFIILHGTDTMVYTASALSFILVNLKKPVIVTGSQLPASNVRTDAVQNFTNSVHIAAYKSFNLPKISEVVICFADKILRGNRAVKNSSTQWAGFDSLNFPPLGKIGEHITINSELLLEPNDQEFNILTDWDDRIMNINLFPGFKAAHLETLIDSEEIQGVVMNTYGAGNAPGDEDFLEVIGKATTKNKIIMNVTQCEEGMVEMGLYASSSGLLERGVVSGLDITTEAAIVKLMWTLGTKPSHQERLSQLQVSQRGEQSENLFDLRFGEIKKSSAKNKHVATEKPDRRLITGRLKRIVIRISDINITGIEIGENVTINVFINRHQVDNNTPANISERCVVSFDFKVKEDSQILLKDITNEAKSIIGDSDITLAIVSSNENAKFYYKGLYLALFAKSEDRKL